MLQSSRCFCCCCCCCFCCICCCCCCWCWDGTACRGKGVAPVSRSPHTQKAPRRICLLRLQAGMSMEARFERLSRGLTTLHLSIFKLREMSVPADASCLGERPTDEGAPAPQGQNLTVLHAAAAAESSENMLCCMPWHLCIKIKPAIRLITSSCARPYFGRLTSLYSCTQDGTF